MANKILLLLILEATYLDYITKFYLNFKEIFKDVTNLVQRTRLDVKFNSCVCYKNIIYLWYFFEKGVNHNNIVSIIVVCFYNEKFKI